MTREKYLEMCEMLGSEPLEEEIPLEIGDLALEAQQALSVYGMLRDEWEGFGGVYLGKSYLGLSEILEYTEIEPQDRKFIVMLVKMIDGIRSEELNKRQESNNKKPAG